jgi:hypothetical protein
VNPLVALIAARGLSERLMAEHVADRNGKCKACAIGAQGGNQVWPCSICSATKAAADVPSATGEPR